MRDSEPDTDETSDRNETETETEIDAWTNAIHQGDSLELLQELPEASVHACVCDPPYGLAFMGRSWDDFEPQEYQQWCEEWAQEVKRVLKPGGHLLAFSGNRTHHRLFSGVEDAGFEIRDTITWHYGSGFPKALDVSKSIDKQADQEGEYGERNYETATYDSKMDGYQRPRMDDPEQVDKQGREYHPATEAAERWDGFKTGLKPATEFVTVARVPFDATVAENIQAHGTGALNIDATRIDTHDDVNLDGGATDSETAGNYNGGWARPWNNDSDRLEEYAKEMQDKVAHAEENGRYPSNVVFDGETAKQLDRDNDTTTSTGGVPNGDETDTRVGDFMPNVQDSTGGLGDSGGVSRYFYTSKANKSERTLDGKISNTHPTVKPVDLMEWLGKLATAENQIILDPFCGSGTTCRAAKNVGRRFIGIEKQAQWTDVARVRCGLTPDNPASVRDDDAQSGIETFAADGGE